jgi:hypothetical protein
VSVVGVPVGLVSIVFITFQPEHEQALDALAEEHLEQLPTLRRTTAGRAGASRGAARTASGKWMSSSTWAGRRGLVN